MNEAVVTEVVTETAVAKENVRVFIPPVVTIWLAVPSIFTRPAAVGTTGFVPPSGAKESIETPPPVRAIVNVEPVAEVVTPAPPTTLIFPAEGNATPESLVSCATDPVTAAIVTQFPPPK
jgi:hypothetical protein